MTTGWENHEPAPLEYFHGVVAELFHELRIERVGKGNTRVEIDGSDFHKLIARAKTMTYEKYKKLNLKRHPLKTEL